MLVGTRPRVSLAAFGVAVAIVGAGAGIGLLAPLRVGTVLGMLVGGFLLGLGSKTRPLTEGAAAAATADIAILAAAGVPGAGATGAVAALGSVTPGALVSSLAVSAAAGGFGVHLGDDLRSGLRRPLEDRPAGSEAAPSGGAPSRSPPADADEPAAEPDPEREAVREEARE